MAGVQSLVVYEAAENSVTYLSQGPKTRPLLFYKSGEHSGPHLQPRALAVCEGRYFTGYLVLGFFVF